MAKKKKKASHSSETRHGKPTVRELRQASELLAEYATALSGTAAAMEEHGIKSVSIDGATKLQRGLDLLSQYLGNVERAVSKTRFSLDK